MKYGVTGKWQPHDWARLSDEELLACRFQDLGLRLQDSGLEPYFHHLQRELTRKGLVHFSPAFYLSTEWFVADGSVAIAVPFYLAHPRLIQLERSQVGVAEGASDSSCRKILRHEVGHALANAYSLKRRKFIQEVFGCSSRVRYPERYAPKLHSRSFVRHLGGGYAQSHPDEDFAETFAVWLGPERAWRDKYAEWAALNKLKALDRVVKEIRDQRPVLQSYRRVEPLETNAGTLRAHYRRRRGLLGLERPRLRETEWKRLFSSVAPNRALSAEVFLEQMRTEVCRQAARELGEYQYNIVKVWGEMKRRCRELDLKLATPPQNAKREFTRLFIRQSKHYLRHGHHQVVL